MKISEILMWEEVSKYEKALLNCNEFEPLIFKAMREGNIHLPVTLLKSSAYIRFLFATYKVGGQKALTSPYIQDVLENYGLTENDVVRLIKEVDAVIKQEKVISVAFIPGDQCFVLAKESKLNTLNRLYHTDTMAVYPATVTSVTVGADGTTYSLCVNTGIQTGGAIPSMLSMIG